MGKRSTSGRKATIADDSDEDKIVGDARNLNFLSQASVCVHGLG
jgi:hypothetical protein